MAFVPLLLIFFTYSDAEKHCKEKMNLLTKRELKIKVIFHLKCKEGNCIEKQAE